jgi:hypothetical protein
VIGDTHKPGEPDLTPAEWLAAVKSGEIETRYQYSDETLDGISRLRPTTRESVRQGCWSNYRVAELIAELPPVGVVPISEDLAELVLAQTRLDDYDPMLAYMGVSSADLAAAAGEVAAVDFVKRLDHDGEPNGVLGLARDAAEGLRGDGFPVWALGDELAAERQRSSAYERHDAEGSDRNLEAELALRCRTAALLLEDLAASLREHDTAPERAQVVAAGGGSWPVGTRMRGLISGAVYELTPKCWRRMETSEPTHGSSSTLPLGSWPNGTGLGRLGEIVEPIARDSLGYPLYEGDRVTWSGPGVVTGPVTICPAGNPGECWLDDDDGTSCWLVRAEDEAHMRRVHSGGES